MINDPDNGMGLLHRPVQLPEKPPKRPLIVGAVLGGLIGAGFGLLITLMNMGGNGNWTLAVPGAVFDGAFLGVIVGAIIRESRAKQSEQQRGRLRAILMWLAVGASLLLAWVVLVIRT